jgi:hypothetical protein
MTRTTCMAVACKRCWRGVRAKPMSRLRRRSTRRIPGERRRSTPARSAYWAVNAGVSWRCRAAWSASGWTCGRTVSGRGAPCAAVQARRVGQARQVAPSNRRRITGSPDPSRPGRQLTRVEPWGPGAGWASQALTKAWRSSPSPARRCRRSDPHGGPITALGCGVWAVTRSAASTSPPSSTCRPGRTSRAAPSCGLAGPLTRSCVGAGVVITWVMRSG